LRSNYNIIDRKIQRRNQRRIKEQETHAKRQVFCKTTTFRLDLPAHPGDPKLKGGEEGEKLFKDDANYLKNLLKRNFDKYRTNRSPRQEEYMKKS